MQTQSNSADKNDSAQNDSAVSLEALQYNGQFIDRHIGPNEIQIEQMLKALDLESLDDLIANTVPETILLKSPL